MGGAFVAVANDATAPFWNPAGLGQQTTRWRLAGGLVRMFEGLAQHQFLHAGLQVAANTAVALSWVHLGVDDIPRYDKLTGTTYDRYAHPELRSAGRASGVFAASDDALLLTFARAFEFEFVIGTGLSPSAVPARLSFGANLKLIRQAQGTVSGNGQGFDAGVMLELLGYHDQQSVTRSFGVGVNFVDLAGTKLVWNTASQHRDSFQRRVVLGLAYREALPWLGGSMTVAAQREPADHSELAWGGEYAIRETVFLRAGYNQTTWSAGAGLRLFAMLFDYGFVSHDLGDSHRLSASVQF